MTRFISTILVLLVILAIGTPSSSAISDKERKLRVESNAAFLDATPDYQKQLYALVVKVKNYFVTNQRLVLFLLGATGLVLVFATRWAIATAARNAGSYNKSAQRPQPMGSWGIVVTQKIIVGYRRAKLASRQARIEKAMNRLAVAAANHSLVVADEDIRRRLDGILKQINAGVQKVYADIGLD